ncbi:MAG: hypothetical protein WCD70_13065, partial [Alphaproteobacteria bacterium]
MKSHIILALVCCFILNGCMSADLRQYGSFDPKDKTLTVPAGGGFISDVKDVFKKDGWTLVIDRGPQIEEGHVGQDIHIQKYGTFKTRYRLMLSYNQYDVCLGMFDPAYNYNLSMVDNKSGEEVIAMGGRA